MKKMIALICGLALCLSLAACSNASIAQKEEPIRAEDENVGMCHLDQIAYADAKDIVSRAKLAVKGKLIDSTPNVVINYSSDPDYPSRHPNTLYNFEVMEVLKGEYNEATISVPVLGGEMDGVTWIYAEADSLPVFEEGGEYLLLLETYDDDGYPDLLNTYQAHFDYNAPEALSDEPDPIIGFTLRDVLHELDAEPQPVS